MENPPLKACIEASIDEVEAEIKKHESTISDLNATTEDTEDFPTPVKTNRSP